MIGQAHPAQECLFFLKAYLKACGITPRASDAEETSPQQRGKYSVHASNLRVIWKEAAASSWRSRVSAVPLHLRLQEGFAEGNSSRLVCDKKVFSFFSKKGNLNDLPEAWNELMAATAVHGVPTLSLAMAPFHLLLLHPTGKHHLTALHFLITLLP